MPVVLILNGFRFFFFSNENNEPPHIHVSKGDGYAKFWLIPNIELVEYNDMKVHEIKQAWLITEQHYKLFIDKWNEYFNRY